MRRFETPPSDSAERDETNAFSISSIQRTHGAIRSTRRRASRRLRSDSPTKGASSFPASSDSSGRPQVGGDGLGGEALAAALHAEEQDALGRIEPAVAGSGRRPTFRVAIHFFSFVEAAELVEPLRRRDELEEAAALDEALLQLAEARAVGAGERVVLDDRLRERALGFEERQPLEVGDDAVDLAWESATRAAGPGGAGPGRTGVSTGTNVRRRRLNPADFLRYVFPLPPMATQLKLREVKRKVDEIQRHREQAAKGLEAILRRFWTGRSRANCQKI